MTEPIKTKRLTLAALAENDAPFMRELLNSPGWIANIGDRNIQTDDDALHYIRKVNAMPEARIWTVSAGEPMGIITLLLKPDLPCHDLGFAFLGKFGRNGFAFEAADAVQKALDLPELCAVTVPSNVPSQRLLEKLGFAESGTIESAAQTLTLYRWYNPKFKSAG